MDDVNDRGGSSAQPLAQRVRSGLGWSLLNNAVGRLGTMLSGIVLARILVPEDYGVFVVALVTLNALLSMNELGVSLAVIRRQGDPGDIAPTVMTIALTSSALLYGVCFLTAPLIAAFLGAPQATPLLRVLAINVLIDAVTSVPAALLTRSFQQRRRLVIDLSTFALSSGVSIGCALAGAGAWSLVWGSLAGNLFTAVTMICWAPVRYRPGFDRRHARELLSFGIPLAASSLLMFATLNMAYIMIGSLLGPILLGFYVLAYNLSSWPVNMFSLATRRVSLAAFSKLLHDPPRLRRALIRSMTLLMAVTLPVCALLAAFSGPLIGVLYGQKWSASAAPLVFLAVLGASRVALELAYDYLVAVGRPRLNLGLQGLWVMLLVPALFLGAKLGGVVGVAAGQAVVASLIVLPAYLVVLRRLGISLGKLAREHVRPLAGVAVLVGVAIPVLILLPGNFAKLAVGGCAALAGYALVVLPMRHQVSTKTARPEAVPGAAVLPAA